MAAGAAAGIDHAGTSSRALAFPSGRKGSLASHLREASYCTTGQGRKARKDGCVFCMASHAVL